MVYNLDTGLEIKVCVLLLRMYCSVLCMCCALRSATSIRLSARRETCADPCSMTSPYRRLSRTLGPRWVGPLSALV